MRVGDKTCGGVEFEGEEITVHVGFERRGTDKVGKTKTIIKLSVM